MRKLFNIQNSIEQEIVSKQVLAIQDIVKTIKEKLYQDKVEYINNRSSQDNTCPKCKSVKIVDRMLSKQRSVTDSFNPFLGLKNQHIESYTEKILHCIDCGNEWEKYNKYNDWCLPETDYFNAFYERIKDKYKYPSLFGDVVKPYKDFYAESMAVVFTKLSLSKLRDIFSSVFDINYKKNKPCTK